MDKYKVAITLENEMVVESPHLDFFAGEGVFEVAQDIMSRNEASKMLHIDGGDHFQLIIPREKVVSVQVLTIEEQSSSSTSEVAGKARIFLVKEPSGLSS